MTENLIQEILSQYKKHGWNLRRVLLLPQTEKNISVSMKPFFGDAEIVSSDIDAAWFSRPSTNRRIAWELRHLSEIPFALFEAFEENTDEEILRETRREMETRLKEKTSKKRR